MTSTDMRQMPLLIIQAPHDLQSADPLQLSSKLSVILVCASAKMQITSYLSLIYCLLLCFLTQDSLSIPADAFRDVRNLTTKPLSLYALDSSSDLILPPNVTSRFQEHGMRYRVPNTYVVLRSLFLRNKVQVPR